MNTVDIKNVVVEIGGKQVVGAAPDEFMVWPDDFTSTRGIDDGDKPYTAMELSCVCTDGDPVTAEQDGKTFHGRGLMFGNRLVALLGDTVVVQKFTPEGGAKARKMMKSAVIG